MATPLLSVIVPTLNEAGHLPALLSDIGSQRNMDLEVLVGDGGSSDATESIAQTHGARFVPAKRGRASQMNEAARQARGDYLLFVHADSRIHDRSLLQNAVADLVHNMEESGRQAVAGHFPLRFIRKEPGHTMAYRYMEEKSAFNRVNTTNGDQGFLLSRAFFQKLGGFNDTLPFLEDQELAERIRRNGIWITLPGILHTSARRFEIEGFHRRFILMGMIMGLYHAGVTRFFEQAPAVYQVQHETTRLRLMPFFRVIRRTMLREPGWRESLKAWYRIGRYIRQNAWQPFFFLDVLGRRSLGPGRYPSLAFYDKVFGPLIDFRIFDGVTAVLAFAWYMGVLQGYFWIREKR
ncbi:MAG: TIGR04283 family arsenosugar biosynthesis glycosyltransferase [bacterium]|nr:TIGR04283 family arsenosugar biosynthesis glycosyltransferase [bacterium]